MWIIDVRAGLLKVACMGLMLMFLTAGTTGKGGLQPSTPQEIYNAAVREAEAGRDQVALRLFEMRPDAAFSPAVSTGAHLFDRQWRAARRREGAGILPPRRRTQRGH
jgi:hypothetical protein